LRAPSGRRVPAGAVEMVAIVWKGRGEEEFFGVCCEYEGGFRGGLRVSLGGCNTLKCVLKDTARPILGRDRVIGGARGAGGAPPMRGGMRPADAEAASVSGNAAGAGRALQLALHPFKSTQVRRSTLGAACGVRGVRKGGRDRATGGTHR